MASNEASDPVKSTDEDTTKARQEETMEEAIARIVAGLDLTPIIKHGSPFYAPPYEIPQNTRAVHSLVHRLQAILTKYGYGEELDARDKELMEWLMSFNRSLQLRLGSEGISSIKVERGGEGPGNSTKSFHAVRKDGVSIAFSYRECYKIMAAKLQYGLKCLAMKLLQNL